ncbi:MAG TPA: hypothetical protein VGF74_10310 [Thermoleophilaceae bacterium]
MAASISKLVSTAKNMGAPELAAAEAAAASILWMGAGGSAGATGRRPVAVGRAARGMCRAAA